MALVDGLAGRAFGRLGCGVWSLESERLVALHFVRNVRLARRKVIRMIMGGRYLLRTSAIRRRSTSVFYDEIIVS